MIQQAIPPQTDTPQINETAFASRRLTPQEIERISQPFYQRSQAEHSEYWRKRFQDRRQQEEAEKVAEQDCACCVIEG